MNRRFCLVMFVGSLVFTGCSKGQPTDELIADLTSADAKKHLGAVRLLQDRKGDASKVVPTLIESLEDKNVDVRISAAIGLGNFGVEAKTAIPALEKAQKDKDARVRKAATVAISRIGEQDDEDAAK